MEFNQKELEHLLNCLNFYYSESDHKSHIMEVNSTLCKLFDEKLTEKRRSADILRKSKPKMRRSNYS